MSSRKRVKGSLCRVRGVLRCVRRSARDGALKRWNARRVLLLRAGSNSRREQTWHSSGRAVVCSSRVVVARDVLRQLQVNGLGVEGRDGPMFTLPRPDAAQREGAAGGLRVACAIPASVSCGKCVMAEMVDVAARQRQRADTCLYCRLLGKHSRTPKSPGRISYTLFNSSRTIQTITTTSTIAFPNVHAYLR